MNSTQLLRRLLTQVRPYWPHLGALLALSLLAAPIALLLPLPLKIVVDSVLSDYPLPGIVDAVVPDALTGQASLLGLAIGLLLLAALLNLLQTLASNMLREYAGERMVLDFQSHLFEHVQRLSLAFHDAHGVTHSGYRIQWDAPAVRWLTLDGAIPFTSAVVSFVAMMFVTAYLSLKLALIALVVSPILILLSHLSSHPLRQRWRKAHALQSSAFGILHEVLGALRVVSAFGQEQRERNRFVNQALQGLGVRIRAYWMENALSLLLGLTVAAGTAMVLLVGVRDIEAGALTLGELLLVMGYLTQLYAPLQTIGSQIALHQRSLASLERTFELLDQVPAVSERQRARPLGRAKGEIAFDGVWFGYSQAQPVLQDISFSVPAGARVGVAGPTGAGKTTLLSLLIRFYDPSEGRILLDGVDLRDWRLQDLRRQFSMVLQEPVLFSTSIAENIAYARPGASQGELVRAARAANIHGFIAGLPDGYDTLVGERGLRLSGGERQRVSLARAFLKNAPVLILDEPTSSVDLKTEAVIMEAMNRLMEGRTTFMIAHRLSTLQSCDLLLTLDHGRLVGATTAVEAAIRDLQRASGTGANDADASSSTQQSGYSPAGAGSLDLA